MAPNWLRRGVVPMLSALAVTTLAPPLPVAAANAGFHFSKTVAAAAIAPVLTLTLARDKASAIPGDQIAYSGIVSNTGDSWTLTGQLIAQSHQDAAATVASWWDELQYCLTGCGDGLNQNWTNLAGASGVSSGYTPLQPAALNTGMHLDVVPTAAAGVIYPATGD